MNKEIENRFFEHFKPCTIKDNKYLFEGDIFKKEDIYEGGSSKDTSLHLDLLPQPFIGDIKKAKIIICSLNPGFDKKNDEDEKNIEEHIKKQFSQDEHPSMFWLENDENIKNTGGAKWWRKKLNQNSKKASLVYNIAKNYNNENPEDEIEAVFEWLSKNMAAIELFPYHSKSFKKSLTNCKSTRIIRDYVHELIKNEENDKKLICFTRSFNLWGKDGKSVSDIADGKYVICAGSPRCVTFNVTKDLGKRILEYIGELTSDFKEPLN